MVEQAEATQENMTVKVTGVGLPSHITSGSGTHKLVNPTMSVKDTK